MPGNEPSEDLSRDELYELAQDRDIVGRSIWSGYISFGLVTIPVGLYSAVVALAPKEPEGAEVVDLTEVARRSVEESQARESA